ncbi:hypothetical protein SEA_JEMERALD_32 [Microbacterium phage Jemerald]|nr:hypothetical protein SEA_JUICER_32 [Microbacterium phage Juicer]WNO27271.1 hypothetical protein SEA_JEMERALD_32 [Microbacterium phage Jemerald]
MNWFWDAWYAVAGPISRYHWFKPACNRVHSGVKCKRAANHLGFCDNQVWPEER